MDLAAWPISSQYFRAEQNNFSGWVLDLEALDCDQGLSGSIEWRYWQSKALHESCTCAAEKQQLHGVGGYMPVLHLLRWTACTAVHA